MFKLNKIIHALFVFISVDLILFLSLALFDKLICYSVVPTKIVKESIVEHVVKEESQKEIKKIEIKKEEINKEFIVKAQQSIKFSTLGTKERKKAFISMILPSILRAKQELKKDRDRVFSLMQKENLSEKESLWLKKKKYFFKSTSLDDLYEKMESHPTSIIIAQAIIESGWGTSRFYEEANNVFGIWSFNESEDRIAAGEKRGKKTIYLRKYKSVEQSISDYLLMISTKDAYIEFRELRLESKDPYALVEQLGKYSELGQEYIENLKNTMRKNKLLAYDSYVLDI